MPRQTDLTADQVLALLQRKSAAPAPLHLNVRLTKDDAVVYEHLRQLTPQLTDSQRVKDSVRAATYLLVTKSPVLQELAVFQ